MLIFKSTVLSAEDVVWIVALEVMTARKLGTDLGFFISLFAAPEFSVEDFYICIENALRWAAAVL